MDARRLSHCLRAILKPGDRSRHTCRLALDARRLSHNLRLLSPKAEVVLPAASSRIRGGCRLLAALPWMRGGCRLTCRHEDYWMPKSFYLPPCCGCKAAVALLRPGCPEPEVDLPAASHPQRGGCRADCDLEDQRPESYFTCRLSVDARRLSLPQVLYSRYCTFLLFLYRLCGDYTFYPSRITF